ncbi:hypothetical protein LF41_3018 [Lysobacter dokdonensis DS-58]|uniref:Uncharacterized protein n=1 Tax=Lysobacter dokdonensis DS-58 TaxID=1300345 RepID=A0A0A2WHS5_9GAMM|nr:hypothetical protein [Lysobacter dokdonensis]KGQ19368.1 hypothetical protein LF41_3018 [Lysobacter dokdonensis DS-58]
MSIERVRYRERQRLAAADLRMEQAWRLGMAGRHHLAPHDWGVVRGLRVEHLADDRFRLTPGVAIDGHGREVLVPAPVEFAIAGFDKQHCYYVQLHYCEDPEQLRGRKCEDIPAPRIRQRTAIRVTEDFSPPGEAAGLATARAAGAVTGAPPWPILVARIGRCPGIRRGALIDYDFVPYVRHRAAAIRSPTDNARLQLGLAGRTDVHHFLVSTRNAARTFDKRVGIDREGTLHVWKQLIVTGATATGIASIAGGLQLKIDMPMPAGFGHVLRLDGRVDPDLRTLSASLLASRPPTMGESVTVESRAILQARAVALPFDAVHAASVTVRDVSHGERPVVLFSEVRKRFRRAVTLLDAQGAHALADAAPPPVPDVAFSMQFSATGGLLTPWKATIFRPAATLDADPLLREIHAVTTSKDTDPVPATELRIVGGGADDSDASGRVSIGARDGIDYVPALRMDGGGRIRLLSAPQSTTRDPLVDVRGTVYLPPVGKKDPMLPDLMTLAFIAGHFQVGNVAASPAITLTASTDPDFIYDLKVATVSANLTVKRTLELIFRDPAAGPAEMTVRALETVGISTASATTTQIPVPGLAPPGRKILIAVVMLVEASNKTRVVRSNTLSLEIPP